jgi:hypothetical protein
LSLLRPRLIALAAVAALTHGSLQAQATPTPLRVSEERENFRAAAGGTRLAVVTSAARLVPGESRGNWRQVTLSGWLPAASAQPTQRDGYSLIVSRGGADLSAAADGPAVARLDGGMLLHERERRDAWVRVERTGWMWAASLAEAGDSPVLGAPAASPEGATVAPVVAAAAPARRTVHRSPGGDTVAVVVGGGPLEVLGREGEWARVRLEGWVRGTAQEAAGGPLRDVTLPALREDPERFRGREVVLQLQFVSLERASAMRSDFAEGEHYALTRSAAGGVGFVYLALTPEQVAAFRRLSPLQRMEVVGRVRTGRSAQMGHPVLELISLRPL